MRVLVVGGEGGREGEKFLEKNWGTTEEWKVELDLCVGGCPCKTYMHVQ